MDNSLLKMILENQEECSEVLKDSKEFNKTQDKIDKIITDVTPSLSENERYKLLWDITLLHGNMIAEKSNQYFKEGMRCAFRLFFDLFTDI